MGSLAGVEQISTKSAVLRTRNWSTVAARTLRGTIDTTSISAKHASTHHLISCASQAALLTLSLVALASPATTGYTSPAMIAPTIGATQNSHNCER